MHVHFVDPKVQQTCTMLFEWEPVRNVPVGLSTQRPMQHEWNANSKGAKVMTAECRELDLKVHEIAIAVQKKSKRPFVQKMSKCICVRIQQCPQLGLAMNVQTE